MGNKRFDSWREVLVLPSRRTLERFKGKQVATGSGIQAQNLEKLQEHWSAAANCPEDYDCILMWDATGYKKNLIFDKSSGHLLG